MKELEFLKNEIEKQEKKCGKIHKEYCNIIEKNGSRLLLKRNGDDEIINQLKTLVSKHQKELEKSCILKNALELKKKHISDKIDYIFNESIYNAGIIYDVASYKRNKNKLMKELEKNEFLKDKKISFYNDTYIIKFYIDDESFYIYNNIKTDNYNCYIYNYVENRKDIEIKDDKYYIELSKKILKKQKQLNDKIEKLKKEAESFCNEVEENENIHISKYLSDRNMFNFITK